MSGTPTIQDVYEKATRVIAARAATTSAPANSGTSASNLLSTLAPVALFALIYLVVFLVIRSKFPRQYMPRTFLGSLRKNERTPSLPTGLFGWFKSFFALPDSYVLNHHSLDGYLLLRFLKMSVVCCLVGMCITWPVLFPVNATGGGTQKQLDILNMSNITNSYYRYFAHAGCAYLFYGFILFMITRESIFYINLRQAYLLSPLYASRLSSRTVLFTSVPAPYLEEENIRRMLGPAVKRIWIASKTDELDDLVKQRNKTAMKLEGAEVKLIKKANGKRIKAEKKSGGKGKSTNDSIDSRDVESGSLVAKYLSPKDRPTHRLKPLIGKKVDTIDWCRSELERLIPKVDTLQAKHIAHDSTKVGSIFVEFTTLAEAQSAYQSLTHHQVLHMAPRFTGMTPDEIIWKNLRIQWWERVIRGLVATAFVTVLVIFWSVPVAFVGAISNVHSLATTYSWLSWLLKVPTVIFGVVSGLLPSVLLAVLMALLPIILRLVAKLSGDPTRSAVELSTQNYYFAFQVVDVFLVTTLGSSASSAASQIKGVNGVTTILAQTLPKASDFYYSYFILQGLAVVSSKLLAISGLVVFILLSKILDKTPRKLYKRWTSLASIGWGTLFPIYETLFVIALCYAIIAPLLLVFAAIGLYLFYLVHRYNLLFVSDANIDTKGRVYPLALQHLFVGLYISQLCIIGLFAIGTGSGKGAIGPLILMIILLIFTILYQLSLNKALKPLIDYLPKSMEAEERRLLEEENMADEKGLAGKDGMEAAPHKKPNFLTKFLKPHIYNDYATMRRLVPKDIAIRYEPEEEATAYYAPSIKDQTPLLWIPRDPMGISRQEVAETSKVIPITDEGAELDAKNKIIWDAEGGRPPIWQPRVYY